MMARRVVWITPVSPPWIGGHLLGLVYDSPPLRALRGPISQDALQTLGPSDSDAPPTVLVHCPSPPLARFKPRLPRLHRPAPSARPVLSSSQTYSETPLRRA